MSNTIAWLQFALGVAHILFGLVKFRVPLAAALADGFIDQFKTSEVRRTAFWFLISGPLIMLSGHAAVHAVAIGDMALIRIIGYYALAISIIGVAALPKSPFLVSVVLSGLLVAVGRGWIA
jgi:hypothetical protein